MKKLLKKKKYILNWSHGLAVKCWKTAEKIFRTGDVMTYAAHALGLKDFNTFVIANGIFATMLTDSQMYSCRVRYISLSPINILPFRGIKHLIPKNRSRPE